MAHRPPILVQVPGDEILLSEDEMAWLSLRGGSRLSSEERMSCRRGFYLEFVAVSSNGVMGNFKTEREEKLVLLLPPDCNSFIPAWHWSCCCPWGARCWSGRCWWCRPPPPGRSSESRRDSTTSQSWPRTDSRWEDWRRSWGEPCSGWRWPRLWLCYWRSEGAGRTPEEEQLQTVWDTTGLTCSRSKMM